MNSDQKAVILTALADRLHQAGSWCGVTHIQKAFFVFQELFGVATGLRYVLYKHGPYSFDVQDELSALNADGLLEVQARPAPYGPSLLPTDAARQMQVRRADDVRPFRRQLDFVGSKLGRLGVADLERLATGLYVTRREMPFAPADQRAARLHELKPHIPMTAAKEAIETVDGFLKEARKLQEA